MSDNFDKDIEVFEEGFDYDYLEIELDVEFDED